jgi:hypothetical protein
MLTRFTINELLTFFLLTFGISWGLPRILFLWQRNDPNFKFSLELYGGIWHMPSFVSASLYQSTVALPLVLSLPNFVGHTIAKSIILTVVYKGAGGSMLLVFLLQ